MKTEMATVGGGCFWCVEAIFDQLDGVETVISGYAGGPEPDPTYQQVCSGLTGHAEVVQVTFDPSKLSFREILEIFLVTHDPTTLNRQGADRGPQYRSVILYHSEAQLQTAKEVIADFTARRVWPDPIVTELAELTKFYPAEEYHQKYFELNFQAPYCVAVILPKVLKLRERFAHRLRAAER